IILPKYSPSFTLGEYEDIAVVSRFRYLNLEVVLLSDTPTGLVPPISAISFLPPLTSANISTLPYPYIYISPLQYPSRTVNGRSGIFRAAAILSSPSNNAAIFSHTQAPQD